VFLGGKLRCLACSNSPLPKKSEAGCCAAPKYCAESLVVQAATNPLTIHILAALCADPSEAQAKAAYEAKRNGAMEAFRNAKRVGKSNCENKVRSRPATRVGSRWSSRLQKNSAAAWVLGWHNELRALRSTHFTSPQLPKKERQQKKARRVSFTVGRSRRGQIGGSGAGVGGGGGGGGGGAAGCSRVSPRRLAPPLSWARCVLIPAPGGVRTRPRVACCLYRACSETEHLPQPWLSGSGWCSRRRHSRRTKINACCVPCERALRPLRWHPRPATEPRASRKRAAPHPSNRPSRRRRHPPPNPSTSARHHYTDMGNVAAQKKAKKSAGSSCHRAPL
jgi:hypothetical protein